MAIDDQSDKFDNTLDPSSIDPIADAKRVFDVLRNGGLAIIPVDVGYAISAGDSVALERAFHTKQRKPHKRHAMIGSWQLHQNVHTLPPREAGMCKLLVHDLDLPLGLVAPFKEDHPLIKKLGPETLARSSVDGTLAMLVNGGALMDELARLSLEHEVPIMGSSANLTGKGTKAFVKDIEPEITNAASIIIDYGKMKYNSPRTSSTMIDFSNVRLLRYGACYDVIQDALKRCYNIEFPDDPGKDVLFSGHAIDSMNKY